MPPLGESLAISRELGMWPLMERVLSGREILKAWERQCLVGHCLPFGRS